tara:strand:- start:1394 stop:1831 length:438 start_codon:yes stop_codon:yes gene_type:complete
MKITNIDTLSALFDRLISENIKLYFFKKDNLKENIDHQEIVISSVKEKLSELFTEVLESGRYKYLSEKRTYKSDDIIETLEELINNDVITGEGDRANLKEATSDNPSLENFIHGHKVIRKANEKRALNKNKLDEQFKKIVEESNK